MIKAFLGPAGTGKTFQLIKETDIWLTGNEMLEHQALLALTFMHGSRKRLKDRLKILARKHHVRLVCETIDSFALRLVRKFREHFTCLPIDISFSNANVWEESDGKLKGNFDTIRLQCKDLLSYRSVENSLRATYPLILIDEFQDCEGTIFELMKSLVGKTNILIAADGFQLLSPVEECPAIEWLSNITEPIILSDQFRTSNETILGAAASLRFSESCSNRPILLPVDGSGLAAWEIMSRIAWKKWKEPVLLAPASIDKSKFVNDTLISLQRELGKKKKIGPIPFYWSASRKNKENDSIYEEFDLNSRTSMSIQEIKEIKRLSHGIVRVVAARLLKRAGINGYSRIDTELIKEMIDRNIYLYNTFGNDKYVQRQAMTIHSAKNREFESVFILWPYQVHSDSIMQRKLLYNAITRAKKNAIVLVQGGKKRVKNDAILNLLTLHNV